MSGTYINCGEKPRYVLCQMSKVKVQPGDSVYLSDRDIKHSGSSMVYFHKKNLLQKMSDNQIEELKTILKSAGRDTINEHETVKDSGVETETESVDDTTVVRTEPDGNGTETVVEHVEDEKPEVDEEKPKETPVGDKVVED